MITYLLQVSFCWILLYAIYYCLLSRLTFFNVNRVYLMVSLFSGLFLPWVGPYIDTMNQSQNLAIYFESVNYTIVNALPKAISIWEKPITYINLIYFLGAFIAALKFFLGLFKIYQLYINGKKEIKEKYTIIHTDAMHLPFSFFNTIFFSKKLALKDHVKEIVLHEEVHINLWHSMDIVIIELLHIFFWFNPMLIFYKKSLKASHEYTADKILLNHISKEAYSMLLIGQTTSGIELALSNQFFNSFIKNRITMMDKKQSSKIALIKYACALPIIVFLLYAFSSCKENTEDNESLIKNETFQSQEKSHAKVDKREIELSDKGTKFSAEELTIGLKKEDEEKKPKDSSGLAKSKDTNYNNGKTKKVEKIEIEKVPESSEKEVYQEVEQSPQFPGGNTQLMNFIGTNLKYPQEARTSSIEGMVVVRFVVRKDGTISNTEILRGIGGGCDDEAKRVVNEMNNMPVKWTPGKNHGVSVNVAHTLPIKFKLTS